MIALGRKGMGVEGRFIRLQLGRQISYKQIHGACTDRHLDNGIWLKDDNVVTNLYLWKPVP